MMGEVRWQELARFAPERCDTALRLEGGPALESLAVVDAAAQQAMQEAAAAAPTLEVMGLLLGHALQDEASGATVTLVQAMLPLQDAAATRTAVCATAAAWERTWPTLPAEAQVVGWFHSHPGHGVFFSDTDRQTQQRYFSAAWQVGIVMDPVAGAWGGFRGGGCVPVALRVNGPRNEP